MADEDVKDLRSVLAEAIAASETSEPTPAPTPSPAPVEAAEAAEDTETPPETEGSRERDASGRFLPKEAASETEPKPAKAAPKEPTEPETPAVEEKPTETPSIAPAHWSQADKEFIASLPKEHQAKVVERFKQIEQGFTPKLQRLSQLEKEWGAAFQTFEPHMETIRQRGQTPADMINVYAGMEQTLVNARIAAQQGRQDPNGAALVARIIQGYNIDPGAVAQYLQGNAQPAQNGQTVPPPISPEYQQIIAPVAQQVSAITQYLQQQQQADHQRRVGTAQSQIDTFRDEKNSDGTLKNAFFSELEPVIVNMAKFKQSQGQEIDLPALYNEAMWANQSTRDRQLSSQRQADESRAAAERKARSDAAVKASSSVSGAPSPGQASQRSPSNRSIRETLQEAMAEQDGR